MEQLLPSAPPRIASFLDLGSDSQPQLQRYAANRTPWISAVNREVKPNLSFSVPLGTFNPYSSGNDNKNLMEVRRKEQRD